MGEELPFLVWLVSSQFKLLEADPELLGIWFEQETATCRRLKEINASSALESIGLKH